MENNNIIMISGDAFKRMLEDAAYAGAKKALAEAGTCQTIHKERLSLKDAAAYITEKSGVGMSSAHLKTLLYKGDVVCSKINGKLSFLAKDLDFWIEKNAQSFDQSLIRAAQELNKSVRRKIKTA